MFFKFHRMKTLSIHISRSISFFHHHFDLIMLERKDVEIYLNFHTKFLSAFNFNYSIVLLLSEVFRISINPAAKTMN